MIGSGLMGHGVAQMAAMSGQEVSLIDVSDELLAKAMQKIGDSLNKFIEKGRIKESPQNVLKRLKVTTDLRKGVSDADLVIEAVPEDIDLKREIFAKIDAHAPKHAILASNTTGLSITVMAEATKREEKVIGMHWANPPQLMKATEVIKGKYTGEETFRSTLDLIRRYEREPIVAQKDVWNFLTARARLGWVLENMLTYLRKEADAKECDAVARYKVGLPMGEFELADFLGYVPIRIQGYDSVQKILKNYYPGFEPWPALLSVHKYMVEELWRPMMEKGLSGIKTGKGFYEYPEGKYVKPEIPQELAEKFDPIQLLAPAVNVASWCVTNGVGSIDDVNKSFRLTYGWPKGLFEFVDEYGADNIASVLKAKEKKAPARLRDFYKVDPLIANWKS